MSETLAVPKGKIVKRPQRKPDMISKRGVPYWFGPNWVRATNRKCNSFSRIIPVALGENNVALHMLSKTGNMTYIQGSIQYEFRSWHQSNNEVIPWRDDMEFDCLLLGVDPQDILLSDWEYEDS